MAQQGKCEEKYGHSRVSAYENKRAAEQERRKKISAQQLPLNVGGKAQLL